MLDRWGINYKKLAGNTAVSSNRGEFGQIPTKKKGKYCEFISSWETRKTHPLTYIMQHPIAVPELHKHGVVCREGGLQKINRSRTAFFKLLSAFSQTDRSTTKYLPRAHDRFVCAWNKNSQRNMKPQKKLASQENTIQHLSTPAEELKCTIDHLICCNRRNQETNQTK